MNNRFNIRYFNKKSKKFEYLKIGAVNFNLFTDCTVYEQGQFCTGLKDKNGKLIYEGDILGGIYHGYIEYCKDCKCFQLFVKDYGCLACEGDLHWYELVEAEEQNELEVIGNIYENKELLDE